MIEREQLDRSVEAVEPEVVARAKQIHAHPELRFDEHQAALAWMEQHSAGEPLRTQALPPYSHSFTHFDLTLQPIVGRNVRELLATADAQRYCWYDVKQPAKIGLAKPAVDLIRGLVDLRLD